MCAERAARSLATAALKREIFGGWKKKYGKKSRKR